jgi:small conductance mechanosensitive channel
MPAAAPAVSGSHGPGLDLGDTLTGHAKLWQTYGHDITTVAVNLLAAVVILLATVWAASWGSKLVREATARLHRRHGEPDTTLQSFVGSLARYLILIVGAVAVLQQLGVKTTSVLAVLGAASIAVGLALQGALANVAAGVMLLLFRPYRVGDLVEIAGRMGTVKALDLFVTELATVDNLKVVAPNGKIFGDFIVNYTTPTMRRVDVVFHIGPKQDLAAVLEAMKTRLADDKRVLTDPAPAFEANALTEAFAEGAVRAWVEASDYGAVKTMIVLAVQALSMTEKAGV